MYIYTVHCKHAPRNEAQRGWRKRERDQKSNKERERETKKCSVPRILSGFREKLWRLHYFLVISFSNCAGACFVPMLLTRTLWELLKYYNTCTQKKKRTHHSCIIFVMYYIHFADYTSKPVCALTKKTPNFSVYTPNFRCKHQVLGVNT